MTMLDDDRLAALLGRAAEAFEVPESGPAEVLARAAAGATPPGGDDAVDGPDDEERRDDAGEAGDDVTPFDAPGRGRRLVAGARRHRLLSVAASVVVVLVVAGTLGAVLRSPSAPTRPAVSLQAPPKAGGGGAGRSTPGFGSQATTTTTPSAHAPESLGAANGSSSGAGSTADAAGTNTATGTAAGLPTGAVGQSAKIEQTGTLGLTVKRGDLTHTMARLTALANTYGGFVASSQNQSGAGGGTPYGTITLQVPVDNFSAVMKAAEGYGKSTNVSTKATDVTGQYVDLQARLTALEATRQQYLTILAKATSIGDILAVQEQLDTIQQQIEQLQGQLQVLTSETSYSTVTATVSEQGAPPRPGPLPESGLVQAWHDSVGGFVAGVEGVVRIAGSFLFALLCLAVAAIGGRVLWRRYQRHRL